MGSFMSRLADMYLYGVLASIFIVVGVYVFYSVRVLLSCRKNGIDICASAMIPVYNLTLPVRVLIKKHKEKQIYGEDEEIEL